MDNKPDFDNAYWLHQPKAVRALRDIGDEAQRLQLTHSLLELSFILDLEIMVWGWDPYKVMFMRHKNGYTWYPAMNQPPVQIAPGLDFPNDRGLLSYDPAHPPAGSIKVSIDIADYPPIDPPVKETPAPILNSYVGSDWGAGVYSSLEDDPADDGQQVQDPRGAFVKHKIRVFGGLAQGWYTKVG